MADSDYESVLCVKPEVHVYRIPPRSSNRGYRAAEWQLDQPAWSGRLRITSRGKMAYIKLEDKTSGRRAFIGVGFADRGDAFDFNVALQDHFKWVKQQTEFAKQAQNPETGPKLDLGFKEGQTIKINIANMKKKEGPPAAAAGKPRPLSSGPSLLPPPPGSKAPPPQSTLQPAAHAAANAATLLDLGGFSEPASSTDTWGDFTKAAGSNGSQSSSGWVQF
ncbi:adaptin ear-binding coat-associated protein 2 isoform X2 [Hyperolius riggenbachi]|uniref:adaptin ear-binding coat-associated protein 2 isoform X2 n=1 Tax=Hyperolius riggenbachi TaxID=752182 RepID=UPI0035A34B97